MAKPEMIIDGPVPGMSLTAEPKGRPWRNPYQFSTIDEVVEYYIPVITDPQFGVLLVEQVENKIPLSTIADILITANTMEGKHSIDLGVLATPVLIEGMAAVAENAGYTPILTPEDEPLPDREINRRAVEAVRKEKKMSADLDKGAQEAAEAMRDESEGVDTPDETEAAEAKPVRSGLMAPPPKKNMDNENAEEMK